jgi:hypothetical protein
MPYSSAPGVDATLHDGTGVLEVRFESQIASDGTTTTETDQILQSANNYALLTCANSVVPPFLASDDPSFSYKEAGALVSPFFFKDISDPNNQNEMTFFVQPSLTETVIQEWDGWAIAPSTPIQIAVNPSLLNQVNVVAQVPTAGPIAISPGDSFYSVFPMQKMTDWATSPEVAISYSGASIGKSGGIQAAILSGGALKAGLGTRVSNLAISAFAGPTATTRRMLVGEDGVNLNLLRVNQSPPVIANGRGPLVKS